MGARNPSDSTLKIAVRAALRTGISAVTLGSGVMALDAYAAQTPTANLEEVVVTGIRQSLESAIEIKREAEQIVDSVTAQDIGALPDRSVSEALQRIPGITLQRTNENRDPARLASEGGGVFIRGLSWVRSETNGRDIFSANNGRALSFEDVSSDLLSAINVYKNPSADMIEGGIGGIVDLRTRTPFETEDGLLAVSADYNYADLLDDGFTSGNALYNQQWETDAGRFGALLSFSVGNIGNRTDSIQTGRYEALVDAQGRPIPVAGHPVVYFPNSIGWRRIDWEQERTAANVALQFAPNDAVVFTLTALRAKADPRDVEYAIGDYSPEYDPARAQFDSRGVFVGGGLRSTSLDADTRATTRHNKTQDVSLNMQYTINDNWSFGADVQAVESKSSVVSMTAYTEHGDQGGTLDMDLSGDTPFMRWNEDTMADPRAYWWAAAMDHIEDNEADEVAGRMDLEYTFDDNPWLKSLRFGARATDKEATTRQTGYNWSFLSQQFWGGDGTPVRLGDGSFPDQYRTNNNNTPDNPADDFQELRMPGRSNARMGDLGYVAQLIRYNDFFRGDVRIPGVAWFPSAALVANGTQNAYETLKDTQTAGWGWAPLTEDSYASAKPGGDNVTGGINEQIEKTQAGYVMLRFGSDNVFDGNIGARIVHTETDAKGLALTVAALQGGTPAQCAQAAAIANADPTIPDLNCAQFSQAYTFSQAGGSLPAIDGDNSYTDVLPTLNVRFFLTDDLQLRFAAGKAISRPSFAQMVPYTTLGFNFTNFYPNAGGAFTGSGGNPKLKPTRSTQLDTSLEWYFARGGSVTTALFYKDIKDYIFIGNEQETYTAANGQAMTFLVSRNMNGAKGRVRGFEVGYQQFYDMLPGALGGLGFQANFTYVDSSGGKNTAINILEPAQVDGAADQDLPLEGLSKTSYNVAMLYEKYDFSARLAYNWREKYLLTTSAANIQRPVWMEDYGQLDGSVFYSISDKVKVGVQATNILNSRTFLDVGGVTLNPRYSWTDTDRRIAFAVRSTF